MHEKLEISKLQKEKRKLQSKGDTKEVAAICNKIGELHCRLGNYDDAIVEHEQELSLCEELRDELGMAVAHRRVGECYSEMGNYDRALLHQRRHLELAKRSGSVIEQQRAHATIGRTHYQRAEACGAGSADERSALEAAESSFHHSLGLCEKLKGTISELEYSEMKARLLLNFGLVYDCRGNISKCAELIKRAIQTAERHKLYEDLYRCQYNLSGIYQRTGNLSQALRHVDVAIRCSVTMKDKISERESLILKGKIFLQLGDISAAKRTLRRAYKMQLAVNETDQSKLANLLKNAIRMGRLREEIRLMAAENLQQPISIDERRRLMKLHERFGDIAAALECFQLALNHYLSMEKYAVNVGVGERDMIAIYVSIAQTYSDLKRYAEAISYFRKELSCRRGDSVQECRTWLNIASLQDQDGADADVVKQSYRTAIECARRAGSARLEASALDGLKAVQHKSGDDDEFLCSTAELDELCRSHDLDPNDLDDGTDDGNNSHHGNSDDGNDDDDVVVNLDDIDVSDDSDGDIESDRLDGTTSGKKRVQGKSKIRRNEKGESPLHRACIEGNLRKVKQLIETGHPVNPRDYCGWLPLHEAANHGFVDIVAYLLDKGALIDDRGGEHCGGVTPLHDACSCGNVGVVQLLVTRGANVTAKDSDGHVALDALMEFYHRSCDELGDDEIRQIKELETVLQNKMSGSFCGSSAGRAESSSKSRKDSATRESLGRLRRRHLNDMRRGMSLPSDVEPDSDDGRWQQTANRSRSRSLDRSRTSRTSETSRSRTPTVAKEREEDLPDSEENVYAPTIDLTEVDMLHNPATAPMAYRKAISGVRGASHRPEPARKSSSPSPPRNIPALITESQLVGDDWLVDDDDVKSTMKQRPVDADSIFRSVGGDSDGKRRRRKRLRRSSESDENQADDDIVSSTSGNQEFQRSEKRKISDRFPDIYGDSDPEDNGHSEIRIDDYDDDDVPSVTNESDNDEVILRPRSSRIMSSESRRLKRQVRLTEFDGIVEKHSSEKRSEVAAKQQVAVGKSVSLAPLERSSVQSGLGTAAQPRLSGGVPKVAEATPNVAGVTASIVSPNLLKMRLKVKIADQLLLVPVLENDLIQTVSWLAGQVADRYYQLHNIRPFNVTLSLQDGARLAPNDLIASTFVSDEEVVGNFDGWDLPCLSTRYADACTQLSSTMYANVKRQMLAAERSNSLQLANMALRLQHFRPVARAVQFQSALRELDVSSNRLCDDGLQHLIHVLHTLPNLTLLDVGSNSLTEASVNKLALVLNVSSSANKPLQQLEKLVMSCNALGSACTMSLARCIRNLPRLETLNLSSCELGVKLFDQHRLVLIEAFQAITSLRHLDVSDNALGSAGIEQLLRGLNKRSLLSLNVSGTTSSSQDGQLIVHLSNWVCSGSGSSLEVLHLSNCNLKPDEMLDLCRLLRSSKSLQKLVLNSNPQLTAADLAVILSVSSDETDSQLSDIEFCDCGLTSPLGVQVLGAIRDATLAQIRLSCAQMSSSDTENLRRIWELRWQTRANVSVAENKVSLTVDGIVKV